MMQAVGSRAAVPSGFVASESRCVVSGENPLLGSGGLRAVSCRWQRRGQLAGLRAEARKSRAARPSAPVGVRCEVITVDEGSFEKEVLKSEVPVLVDFWANWCGPCKLVAKSMDVVDENYKGNLKVVKIETDPNPTLVQMYQVYGLPTLILFSDGEVVKGGRCEGAISLAKIKSMVNEALPSLVAPSTAA